MLVDKMKRVNFLLFIFFMSFAAINNVKADVICNYRSSDNKFQATIVSKLNEYNLKITTANNIVYDGKKVNSGTVTNWEDTNKCYDYIGIYQNTWYGLETTYSYELYATDNIKDLKSKKDNYQIMVRDGKDDIEEDVGETNTIYYPGATGALYGNVAYVREVPEDVYFKFISYDNGSKEFCVLIDDNTECDNMNDNIAPVISISGSKKNYKFSIDSNTSSYFFNELSSENWRFDVSTDVYKLVYHKELDDNKDNGFSPDDLCKDGGCNISLSGLCENPNVSSILKGVGILVFLAKVLVPAIIIGIGFVNLFKLITSGKEEDAKKYAISIVKRIGVGVIIFLLPTLINFVYNIADDIIGSGEDGGKFTNCVNCVTSPSKCNTSGNS